MTQHPTERDQAIEQTAAVIAAKDETIEILRRQLDAKTDELRAAHVIVSQLTQRMPAIAAVVLAILALGWQGTDCCRYRGTRACPVRWLIRSAHL